MQDEEASVKREPRRVVEPKHVLTTFSGLEESDFKDNVAGTTWRSRSGLGGLVAQGLSELSGVRFVSLAIYRRPQFYVYTPELPIGRQEEGVKLPKFIVELSSEFLSYGFYIEKSNKPMGSEWYWLRFMNLLSDTAMQEAIERIRAERKLSWVMRFERSGASDADKAFEKTINSPFREGAETPTFSVFLAYLQNLPTQRWCNLFIEAKMKKSEALEMQKQVSRPISTTLGALVPMYLRLLKQGR